MVMDMLNFLTTIFIAIIYHSKSSISESMRMSQLGDNTLNMPQQSSIFGSGIRKAD
jgi:hypothetical protein